MWSEKNAKKSDVALLTASIGRVGWVSSSKSATFIIVIFFLRWLYELLQWMKNSNHIPTGKSSLNRASLPGPACRWKSHPLYNNSKHCWKISTPHFTILICQVRCDVTKRQIVVGHFTLVLQGVGLCVCVRVFCFVCVVVLMLENLKWLTALAWPKFSLWQCHWEVCVIAASFANTVELLCAALKWACQWVYRVREDWIRLASCHDFDLSDKDGL